jgi:hypothetical protein
MKEEFNKAMETSGEKKELNRNSGNENSLSQIKYTGECHSSRLEQVEDRISGFEHKIDIFKKTEEILDKRIESCKGIHKNSATPLKDQSWASKQKRCKPKGYVIYSTKQCRKLPKS